MGKVFLKSGPPAILAAEAEGLRAIAATNTIRVPRVLDFDAGRGRLSLEWLDLAPPDAAFGERFGCALAALHLHPCPAHDGWSGDNFIGLTPQINAPCDDWLVFWRESRLVPMFERLQVRDCPAALADTFTRVIETMPALFADGLQPRPSLIHGDLWSGNCGMLQDGTHHEQVLARRCTAQVEVDEGVHRDVQVLQHQRIVRVGGDGMLELFVLHHPHLGAGGPTSESSTTPPSPVGCR